MEDQITPQVVANQVAQVSLEEELNRISAVRQRQSKIDRLVANYAATALVGVGIDACDFSSLQDMGVCRETLRSLAIPLSKSWWIQLLAKIASAPTVNHQSVNHQSVESILQELRDELPCYEIELSLIERVGLRLEELIKTEGTSAIVQTLFSDDVMSRWYTQSVTYDVFNRMARESLRCILASVSRRPIRVLEVGAGTGGLTANLLDLFPRGQTEYHFTDVGSYFLRSAKRRFSEFPFVRYERLDLERSCSEQGFLENSCELVIANNVIHDTKNVSFTLQNLSRTLVPGGMMLMVELTDPQTWWHMCFGSLEGWWRFKSDPSDFREDLMLIKRSQWIELIRDSGFVETAVVSDVLPIDFANRLFLSQTDRNQACLQ